MSIARDKLMEAAYFYRRMEECQADRDSFRYNLSAFLAAAHSARGFLREEFGSKSSFSRLYNREIAKVAHRQFLAEQRVFTIHFRPVVPRAEIDVQLPPATLRMSGSLSLVHTRGGEVVESRNDIQVDERADSVADEVTSDPGQCKTEYRWYFDGVPDKDVLSVCREYLDGMTALVAACQTKYTQGP
jgi:hypothetical protein